MEEKKKKDEENSSVKVNQPIWRNSLQRISGNLPPKQQFRLPIPLCHNTRRCQLANTLRAEWGMCTTTLPWRPHITEPSEVTGLCTGRVPLPLWFYGQVWLVRVNILFQNLTLRLTHSSLIMKIIHMSENVLSPGIVDSEHFGVRRDKSNTLRIKRDSILD